MTFFLFFLLVVLVNTQSKTARLNTPTVQLSPAQQKILHKFVFLFPLWVGALITYTYEMTGSIPSSFSFFCTLCIIFCVMIIYAIVLHVVIYIEVDIAFNYSNPIIS